MSEKPFKISVPDSQLDLLKSKLALAVFPDELEESGHQYGAPLKDIRRLVYRWQNGYNWREHEARLNALLPQFTRPIEVEGQGTLEIHYVHKWSQRANAIPLLFVHGWPGSFIEVSKILNLLVEPDSVDSPAFHVVAYGLAGFGFSEAPRKKAFALPQHAEAAHKLMLALGYPEYVTQGGDWGHLITNTVASKYGPQHVKAWHTNVPLSLPPNFSTSPWAYLKYLVTPFSEGEKAEIARMQQYASDGVGYLRIQSTRPQTLGYSLADSPVGLLAWIYEKLVSWTDSYPWEDDEVLTWISIYLFSQPGPAASLRLYYEAMQQSPGPFELRPTSIPMGVSYFPKEILASPASWISAYSNLVFVSRHEHGGHFAAYERPNDLVDDLRKFYGRGGPAYGLVGGKSGYDS